MSTVDTVGDNDRTTKMLAELRGALTTVAEERKRALADAIAAAGEVFVTGQGRSGLMAAAFATRLVQLGKRAHVVGEATTPAAGPGALVVACSGSGRTRSTLIHADGARAAGARVWAITNNAASPLTALAHETLVIPAGPSMQPGGSLFEQALLLLLDSVVLRLMAKLGQTEETMLARHANLE